MQIEKTFDQENYNKFAELSGDFNPIHVDEKFSAKSGFGKTVAHGIYLTTCLSGALEKAIGVFEFLETKIMFPAPTFCGVEMVFSVQILNQDGDIVNATLKSFEKFSMQETCIIEAKVKKGLGIDEAALKNPASIIDPPVPTHKPLYLGETVAQERIFCQRDIDEFVAMGGHESATNVISPIFINAMFSKLLGIDLPGLGTNYLKQETQYLSSARIGERVNAKVEITRIREDKKIVDFSTTAYGENGRMLATGRALVSARDVKDAF